MIFYPYQVAPEVRNIVRRKHVYHTVFSNIVARVSSDNRLWSAQKVSWMVVFKSTYFNLYVKGMLDDLVRCVEEHVAPGPECSGHY